VWDWLTLHQASIQRTFTEDALMQHELTTAFQMREVGVRKCAT